MDLVISCGDDKLVDLISFQLPSTASYATERRLVAAFPTGASQFEPSGVPVMRVHITRENWLDPSTLRLAFKLRNTSTTHTLSLASGPWSLFSQCRLLMGGTVVEQIDQHE